MRKKIALPVAALAAITLAGGALAASASADSSSSVGAWGRGAPGFSPRATAEPNITRAQDIRLVATENRFKGVDADDNGRFSPGDYILFTETLADRDTGRNVGVDHVTCMFLFDAFQCRGTLTLNGRGDVEIAGTITETTNKIAVTGGTDAFQNARGQLVVGGGTRNTTNLTLQLIP